MLDAKTWPTAADKDFPTFSAGGMRQVGVLAAPGIVALRETPALLHADHKNARLLAEGGWPAFPHFAGLHGDRRVLWGLLCTSRFNA